MPPRLKSLELHGYKTFASRTLFEYPGLITAIVGPNGSGKSNIADAIRWVLGEQSYSMLRGRKTEDMIFSGSEQRSRAGMASAMITFDNSDGWLPIDFSEVAITRRAYRDGQNEYLLNGQRVRLREISELLAQSGLAERTYTIIGQGLVDAALALKPEERRRLFEEAAGIGLYRSRREDALNRLEATRRNLDRVQDILVELEPRLHSLEKQARRVQEYERIKNDLHSLLRDWYGYQWHKAQQEMSHTQEIYRTQESRLENARLKQQETTRQVADYRASVQKTRERLNAWHVQSSGSHSERERISRELAIIDERHRSLNEQLQGIASELTRLEEEIRLLKQQKDLETIERDKLSVESEEAQQRVKQAQQRLENRLADRKKIEASLREKRQLLVADETRQVQVNAHRQELAARVENIDKSILSAKQLVDAATEEQTQAKSRLELLKEEMGQAVSRKQKANDDLQTIRREVEKVQGDLNKIKDDQSRIEGEKVRLNVQLQEIERAEKSLEGLASGARILFQAVKQGKIKGEIRPLNHLLEIPAEYEEAIAGALNEYGEALYVNSGVDLESAFRLLESSNQGRAILIPADWLIPATSIPVPADPDCLGIAADLISTTDELLPLVNTLLSRVLVVKTREAARRVLPGLPTDARAVTLVGEVFHGSGTVLAGKEGRSTRFSRPREKKEIIRALEAKDREIAALSEKSTSIRAVLEQAHQREREAEKESRAANENADRFSSQHHQATLATEQARRQAEWQENQLKNLSAQKEKAAQEIERSVQDLTGLEKKIEQERVDIRAVSARLYDLPIDELQAEVNHWKTTAAVVARALSDAEKRLTERSQLLAKTGNQYDSARQRHLELTAGLENLVAEGQALREKESTISKKIEELRIVIEPAEIDLDRNEKEYQEAQEIDSTAQQALTIAERYFVQAQLEVTRHREALDNLHRRIQEDFGLVALEFTAESPGQTPLPLEGMVEQLPSLVEIPASLEDNILRQRAALRRLGAVNPEAQMEFDEVRERYKFMTTQVADLRKADADLRQVISELDDLMKKEFRRTYEAVAIEFKEMFTRLFAGGNARLILVDADNPAETGIDIEARLPGRREQGLSLLSGGERSLTAVALVFALLKVSPTPFCVMDEVDAMLDEANVGRFRELLRDLSQTTQFIVITHNRNTVQAADVIYGVTMGRDSASQVISLKLDEVSEEMTSSG